MTSSQSISKPQLDAALVNALVKSTVEVLATMAGTEAVFQEVRAGSDYAPQGDISAIIGISGATGEGMFSLSFPLALANLLVARLLGVQSWEVASEDRSDGVGELVNMICGSTKTYLSCLHETAYQLSLPTVIMGSQHEIASRPKNHPYLYLQFETEGAIFHLQVCFKSY